MAKTVVDIVRGIHQAALNGGDHVGASKVGLKREDGDPIKDSRVIDGFAVKVNGNILKVTYSSIVDLREINKKNLEQEYNSMLEKIASFLKTEYKKVTGETLTLKNPSEIVVSVQNVSNVKTFLFASKEYEVVGLESAKNDSEEARKKVEKFESEAGETKKFMRKFTEMIK